MQPRSPLRNARRQDCMRSAIMCCFFRCFLRFVGFVVALHSNSCCCQSDREAKKAVQNIFINTSIPSRPQTKRHHGYFAGSYVLSKYCSRPQLHEWNHPILRLSIHPKFVGSNVLLAAHKWLQISFFVSCLREREMDISLCRMCSRNFLTGINCLNCINYFSVYPYIQSLLAATFYLPHTNGSKSRLSCHFRGSVKGPSLFRTIERGYGTLSVSCTGKSSSINNV
jgi:hypothetical protein